MCGRYIAFTAFTSIRRPVRPYRVDRNDDHLTGMVDPR
jgi:hypothetical protein